MLFIPFLYIHFRLYRGSHANTFFRFLPPAPSEYRHEQMGGGGKRSFCCSGLQPAFTVSPAEGRLEGFGCLPQRLFKPGVQAEHYHRPCREAGDLRETLSAGNVAAMSSFHSTHPDDAVVPADAGPLQ